MGPLRRVLAGTVGWGVLVLFLAHCPRAESSFQEAPWRTLGPGVFHATLRLPGGAFAEAVRVDLRRARLEVLDARAEGTGRAPVRALRKRSGAIAAVNGGFFDEAGAPMGLVVAGGRETNSLRRADWGVFFVAEGRARIVHTRTFRAHPPPKVEAALQAGPRLVVDGHPLKLKPQVARRTAICLRSEQEVVLLVTEAVEAEALARWLARGERDGGLGCREALNLDGGPSSQLSIQTQTLRLEVPGGSAVPNALAVFERAQPPEEARVGSP